MRVTSSFHDRGSGSSPDCCSAVMALKKLYFPLTAWKDGHYEGNSLIGKNTYCLLLQLSPMVVK